MISNKISSKVIYMLCLTRRKSMKFNLYIFITTLLISFSYQLEGRHIIGGDVTYECMGIDTLASGTILNNFRIYFTMYRDCQGGGAQFDPRALIGVYQSGSGGNFSWLETLEIPLLAQQIIEPEASPCVEVPSNICVEEGRYEFDIRLPQIAGSYMLTYQRCCRNVTIANIVNAEDTGASFAIEITEDGQKLCNSSPIFNEFPPIVICAGQPLIVSQSGSDIDGDVLTYEFCSPKQGGGPFGSQENPGNPEACNGITPNPRNCPPPYDDVVFKLPQFSANAPISGDPRLTIDRETGIITGTPNVQGQFVVGVCIKEYRNGVLIGQVNRDFQFNVTECDVKVFAEIEHDAQIGPQEYEIISCGAFDIFFENQSTDPAFIDEYYWEFNINDKVVTSNQKDVSITFPGLGNYNGRMIINPNAIDGECSDTAYFEVNVYPSIDADYEFAYDTCVAGPVSFTDLSSSGAGPILEWDWDFADGGSSDFQNPNHLYQTPGNKNVALIVTDQNECKDTMIKDIAYLPAPPLIIVEPSSFFGCAPASIFFNNLSVPIDSTYDIFWDFGDGNSSTEISPTHVYDEIGVYDVSLQIISPIGCEISDEFPNLIQIEEKPTADFTFSPDEPSSIESTVDFRDRSQNAIKWIWEFGQEGAAFEPNPSYTFRDTGEHIVQLVVVHPNGCPDTLQQVIDVKPVVTYHMPNAFTPNADGQNDMFLGKGITDGMTDFQMNIFNRWGELIFETRDPFEGWNGQKYNDGPNIPNGVYVYKVTYNDPRGNRVVLDGFATLIR